MSKLTLGLPSPVLEVDHTYLSKEEIINYTDINPYTLRNWIVELKPDEDEFEVGKKGVKRYRISYLQKLFEKNKQVDLYELLVNKLSTESEPTVDQSDTGLAKYLRREVDRLNGLIKEKDEQIRNINEENNNRIEKLITQNREDFTSMLKVMATTSNDIKDLFRNSQILLAQKNYPQLYQSTETIEHMDDEVISENTKTPENANNKVKKKKGWFNLFGA